MEFNEYGLSISGQQIVHDKSQPISDTTSLIQSTDMNISEHQEEAGNGHRRNHSSDVFPTMLWMLRATESCSETRLDPLVSWRLPRHVLRRPDPGLGRGMSVSKNRETPGLGDSGCRQGRPKRTCKV